MAKKAVLIGCNYPGTRAQLHGCVNDVTRMYRCLVCCFGFSDDDITVLIDTDRYVYPEPTGRNIRRAITDLIRSAQPGDFLFIHFSGHGTRLRAEDGYDECIVPSDMNLITDDDLGEFVNSVPHGCRIAIVSDSCHSGGLMDDAKEQIEDNSYEDGDRGGYGYTKSWSLPLSTVIEILQQRTGKKNIAVGKLRPALFEVFGEDASPKVKKFMKIILDKHKLGDGESGEGGLAQEDDDGYAQPALDTQVNSKQEVYAGGILISSCQADQTCAEKCPRGNAAGAYGAMTNAIQSILGETDGPVSNQELVQKARKMLKRQGFTQRPGLYCSDEHVDAPFLC